MLKSKRVSAKTLSPPRLTPPNVEQWAVNKAVHYNEWANFGKKDFQPVLAAFKAFLSCFRCDACESWVHVTPHGNPETLRCGSGAINFNLKPKLK